MRILLAMDLSPASQRALDEVATRPWPAGSRIEIVTAVQTSQPWALGAIADELAARGQKLVDEAAAFLRERGFSAAATVLEGDPKTVILDRAAAVDADLIVVGAHGQGAAERFLVGSVSRAVLRFGRCSVAIVRRSKAIEQGGLKVLLAVDGSEGSKYAAASLASRPWPPGTEIRVLSAVELDLPLLQAAFEIPPLDAALLETQRTAAMQRAEDVIDAALTILEAAGLATSESISVLVATPKEIILQEATEWAADWIVLGSHGSSGLSRFLVGSTSETVAAHAHCSVEVVRKKL